MAIASFELEKGKQADFSAHKFGGVDALPSVMKLAVVLGRAVFSDQPHSHCVGFACREKHGLTGRVPG